MGMIDCLDGVLGEKIQYDQINRGQISTGDIHSHHMYNPIRIDIPAMGDK